MIELFTCAHCKIFLRMSAHLIWLRISRQKVYPHDRGVTGHSTNVSHEKYTKSDYP